MSNNDKWKNKKINVKNYEVQAKKPRKELSKSWKIALTALFLFAIPSFLMMLFVGKDGWVFAATKDFSRWGLVFPIALIVLTVQLTILFLLIFKFKKLPVESLNFLFPIAFAMASFIVSSGVDSKDWFIRVLPAVGMALLAVPVILINKAVIKSKEKKQRAQILAEERKNKTLLD
ncbi:hypothetical protein [[Mycoplasma] falconis]|nr:hypothetical protein [[Mycoplasma] falconis]